MNDTLVKALDNLVPEPEDYGDWADVLRRAGVSRPAPAEAPKPRWHWARRRRTVALVLVLVALLVVLFATPALGLILDLIGRKNVPFSGAKPAPAIVKKHFFDLALGLPPRLGPGAIASEAREVGVFRIDGKPHRLWVAPTRRGGYCYTFENSFGGCRADASDRKTALLGVTYSTTGRPGQREVVRQVGGDVTSPAAAEIRLEYADGTHSEIPFVYVSKPIDAGFFAFLIPAAHRLPGKGATAALLLDSKGHVLARQAFRLAPPVPRPPMPQPAPSQAPRTLPPAQSVTLRPPLQRGSAGGVAVVAGKNASVRFEIGSLPANVRRLVSGHGVSYGCFRLTREFGIFTVRGFSVVGALAPSVGLRFAGVGTPFDGCELQGGYGHTWPDALRSHSAAEIALTPAGRRYFAERAAARDLALFVRSRRMHELRKLTGSRLVNALLGTYGGRIAQLRSLSAKPGAHRVGYVPTATGATFVEWSPTGRRFTVTVKGGKIVRENLKPYAFVF
jgi:hypothetical protein